MFLKRIRDWLKNEEANYEKDRKRDRGNNLLANNIDGLIKEEGKLNSNLNQVRELDRNYKILQLI